MHCVTEVNTHYFTLIMAFCEKKQISYNTKCLGFKIEVMPLETVVYKERQTRSCLYCTKEAHIDYHCTNIVWSDRNKIYCNNIVSVMHKMSSP